MIARKLLVYGSTGRTGSLVLRKALKDGWSVCAFCRSAERLPSDLKAALTIWEGNLCDKDSVSAAVKTFRPDAIVDASSSLPFGQASGATQPNNANRATMIRATIDALSDDHRLDDCVVVIVGGVLVAEPGGTINSWTVSATKWLVSTFLMRGKLEEAEEFLRWMFEEAPQNFRFIYCRLGYIVDEPPRGVLEPQPTLNNIQNGSVSYSDLADALVALAADGRRAWERKALFFNYKKD
jgi:putative NADH-flavin reductase